MSARDDWQDSDHEELDRRTTKRRKQPGPVKPPSKPDAFGKAKKAARRRSSRADGVGEDWDDQDGELLDLEDPLLEESDEDLEEESLDNIDWEEYDDDDDLDNEDY